MKKFYVSKKTVITRNESYEGKSIEETIADRLDGEPIEVGGKALLYTLREDGVLPETDIRTDKWAIAQDALDYRDRTTKVKGREAKEKARKEKIEAERQAIRDSIANGLKSGDPSHHTDK